MESFATMKSIIVDTWSCIFLCNLQNNVIIKFTKKDFHISNLLLQVSKLVIELNQLNCLISSIIHILNMLSIQSFKFYNGLF
jgi:hypothetical protein